MSNYIDKAWAENGDKTDVPIDAQGDGSVSYDQGFTDLYDRNPVTDPTALSLARTNFNGNSNKITANLKQWLDQCYPDYYQLDNLGNPVEYKIYSAVRYNNGVYLSKINNNTSLPTNTTNWSLFQTLDFASQAEAIARTATDKWMNPFVTGKLIDNELVSQTPKNAINLSTTNLATITEAGFYFQPNNAGATIALNYPEANKSGTMLVTNYVGGSSNHQVLVYTTVQSKQVFVNSKVAGVFGVWTEIGGTTTDTLNPVGSILMVASNNVPAGYFLTTGTAISRTTYSALFAKIGTDYGAGDGSTTFNLPRFNNDGAFLRGSGSNAAALGVLQGDAIRNITGKVQARGLFGSNTQSASGAFAIDSYTNNDSQPGSTVISNNAFRLDASLQVPTAPENRPLNYSIKICIKF